MGFDNSLEYNCIICGEPVKTKREGKIHNECYTQENFFKYELMDDDD